MKVPSLHNSQLEEKTDLFSNLLGFTPAGMPVHVVCGKNRAEHLLLITVYIPAMPKWKDAYTRNR